jgi:membrane protein implicated in regulation of membrane protease activity
LQEIFVGLIKDIWAQYGPFAALLILLVTFHATYTHRLWTARLRDKDKEIDRLVGERDRLQDTVIQKRISSKKDKAQ